MPYALQAPLVSGVIRARPEDFQVDEVLGYGADGDGEHQLLFVEKTALDTSAVARTLARFSGVSPRDVAFAGRKDRHAVTRQWFSVRLGGKPVPEWQALSAPGIRVLSAAAHRRKLRVGALKANRFVLAVTALDGPVEQLAPRLEAIAEQGVPNYFGPQRYGRNGANLSRARCWFSGGKAPRGRDSRSFALSAARSFLFDTALGERVRSGTWNSVSPGEPVMLDGSRSFFLAEAGDETLAGRLASGDVHPSGPLWGRGADDRPPAEQALADREPELCRGLESAGLKAERRALRVIPGGLAWTLSDDVLEVSFSLPSGSYATSVLREVLAVCDAS
ncbi:MAG: tRNA pseudouridine(13) synthase TruD [Pseudomonadota bacterium]